jgi:putative endonuclease
MKTRRQRIGRWGEDLAATHLAGRGWQILERNARTPYGEIDLVARAADMLVFVEVKARTTDSFGLPEDSLTALKQEHLRNAAEAYLTAHPELEGNWRVDVVAIRGKPGSESVEVVCFEDVLD